MNEKNPPTPYTASEITHLAGDLIKIGKSGTTFHHPNGKFLSRQEIREIVENADLIRSYENPGENEETVTASEAQPEYMKTWPENFNVEAHARSGDLARKITQLDGVIEDTDGTASETDSAYVTPHKAKGIAYYSRTWREVPSEEFDDSDVVPLKFDSEKKSSRLKRIGGAIGAFAVGKVNSLIGGTVNSDKEMNLGSAHSSGESISRKKRKVVKVLGGVTLGLAMFLSADNSDDGKLFNTDILDHFPKDAISSVWDNIDNNEDFVIAAPVDNVVTPEPVAVPVADAKIEGLYDEGKSSSVEAAATPTSAAIPASTPAVTPAETVEPTVKVAPTAEPELVAMPTPVEVDDSSSGSRRDTREYDFQKQGMDSDDDAIIDLTGGAKSIASNESPSQLVFEEEKPEPTIEQLEPEQLTISEGDGFTDLLIKYRPDLGPAEAYELFKYLVSECNGAEHIFTNVTIYPMENGDAGIEGGGTTQFAPGVQELVDNWVPGQ